MIVTDLALKFCSVPLLRGWTNAPLLSTRYFRRDCGARVDDDSNVESHQDVDSKLLLANKSCVPCLSKELQPMSEDDARTLMHQIPDWELLEIEGNLQLQKKLKSKNFLKGLDLLKRIGDIAELEGHHPDLHLAGWNNVTVNIWTHSVGGLTENDFILAAKISGMSCKDLLRKAAIQEPPTST